MITYQYHCPYCGKFEVRRSIFNSPLTSCPKCGEEEIYQIFTAPEVIWKGRFRFMKGNPEIDMDKIDAEQNREARKQAMGKVKVGLESKNPKYY